MSKAIHTNAKRPSNGAMRRAAIQAIEQANRAIFESNKVVVVLLAVLAQHGGEVTVTKGTIDQIDPSRMGFSIADGKNANEKIIRLLLGEQDAQLAGNDNNDNSGGAEPPIEAQVANGAEGVSGSESSTSSDSSGDGSAQGDHRDVEGGNWEHDIGAGRLPC